LEKELPAELRRKTVLTTISAVERTAIRELLARPEVAKLLRENSTMREMGLVEEALAALGKGRLAYGLPEIEDVALQGNVAAIIITENAIAKARNEGHAHRLEALLRQCETTRGEVHVLGSDEAMGKIDGLGGVVAMKRW
jgi:stalled ribosome rescue protein Dom34